MIFERRAYTLRPGASEAFWQLQREYSKLPTIARLRSHNLGYFHAVAGPSDAIVHLYRFDSLDDWNETYGELYREHPAEYFVKARSLLLAQENAFLSAPGVVADGTGLRSPVGDVPVDPLVVETRVDLRPGTAPAYWESYERVRRYGSESGSDRLFGELLTLAGRLHRAYLYSWFGDAADYETHSHILEGSPVWAEHRQRTEAMIVANATAFLRPGPLAFHRTLLRRGTDEVLNDPVPSAAG